MNEQIAATTKIVEEVVSRSQQALEELVKASRAQAEKAGNTAKANFEEVKALNEKNLAALVESTRIVARGLEEASQAVVNFSQKNSEASLAALKKLATAGTVVEAAEIQQSFAKESVTALVGEAERMSALVSTTAREALAPLNERVTEVVDRFGKPLTA
ncbi:MAG: phasin family protein [Rhodospirillaceae bacterium]